MNLHLFLRRVGLVVRREIERLNGAHGFAYEDLCGACAIASWTLRQVLRRLGIAADLVIGKVDDREEDHAWLEVAGVYEEPAILDLTATQFGITPLVVLTPRSGWIGRRYVEARRDRRAFRELVEWEGESPYRYRAHLEQIVSGVVRVCSGGVA